MKLFAKKPATASPPVIDASPPPPTLTPPTPRTEAALKLELPDVFAYEQDATKARAASRKHPDGDGEKRHLRGTVLLVEGDDEICRLISRLLQHDGFDVVRSSCLAEARVAMNDVQADFLLARRHSVPANLQTERVLRELAARTNVRIVDDFAELMLGQVVDYDSMSQCALGLCDLLMSLLEGANVGARGHAHSVAKHCRFVGQRLGFSRRELDALVLAAYLHDLGALETKRSIGPMSLTCPPYAFPSAQPTLEILANVTFPYPVNELLSTAAELRSAASSNQGGADQPDEKLRAAIPRGAHILRVADLYDTLRRTNTREVEEDALFDQMRHLPADVLDSSVLETFIHMRKQERAITAMNIFRAAVLLVDPHPEEVQLLRLRLENDDFHVFTAKSVEEALQLLRREKVSLVVTEHHLDGTGDGFELLRSLKNDSDLARVPIVFHAPANTDLIRQALEQGAEDWFAKPHNVEIAAMKIHRIVSRLHLDSSAKDGAQGSIRDIGIIEMVQVLSVGGRSVQILLTKANGVAEMVLYKGQIISATTAEVEGEAAALEILGWEEGQFRILPLKDPPPVTIRTSTDNLLLQSCYYKDKQNCPSEEVSP
jgi:response regulator RpfG family c-di-GMP phosphodiesterase